LGETRDLLSESSALVALQRAMRAALAWEDKLIGMGSDADATRIRKDLSDDFQRVGDCIAMLIAEVREGRVPP